MTRHNQIVDPLTGAKHTVPSHHGGIDLFATPGTPIYSMFDGVVSDSKYVTEQPMRSESYGTKNKYPSEYKGDKNDSGNRVYIDSYVNGANVSVGYCHLLVNNPVAVNPRTGKPFKPGDVVYQGEIISYPHLHLVVKKNNNFVDPEPYINGKLNTTGQDENKLVSSTEINNIKCH